MQRIAVCVLVCISALAPYSRAGWEPSAVETYLVELVNRGRLNPAAEAARYSIALNDTVPTSSQISSGAKQPVAIHPRLVMAAAYHSADMMARDYYAHQTKGTEIQPWNRCTAAGYTDYNDEIIAYRAQKASMALDQAAADYQYYLMFVNTGSTSRADRVSLMKDTHAEVGAGLAFGDFATGGYSYPYAVTATVDFGRGRGGIYACGVIYDDKDADGFYDVGEGLPNAVVTIVETGKQYRAWASGAYTVPLPQTYRSYTLRLSFEDSKLTLDRTVTVTSSNIKCDFLRADMKTTGTATPFSSHLALTISDDHLSAGNVTTMKATVSGTLPELSELVLAIDIGGTIYFLPDGGSFIAPYEESITNGTWTFLSLAVNSSLAASMKGQTVYVYGGVMTDGGVLLSQLLMYPVIFE